MDLMMNRFLVLRKFQFPAHTVRINPAAMLQLTLPFSMSINGSSADYTSDSGSRVDEFDATITGDIVQEIEDIPDYGGPGKWNPAIISDVTLCKFVCNLTCCYFSHPLIRYSTIS